MRRLRRRLVLRVRHGGRRRLGILGLRIRLLLRRAGLLGFGLSLFACRRAFFPGRSMGRLVAVEFLIDKQFVDPFLVLVILRQFFGLLFKLVFPV